MIRRAPLLPPHLICVIFAIHPSEGDAVRDGTRCDVVMTDDRQADAETLEEAEVTFVQVANAMICHEGTLTLHGVSPSTLYFSAWPRRIVGHIGSTEFVDTWREGGDTFADDPPHAVLAFIDPEADVEDVPVVLRDPVPGDGTLSYSVQVTASPLPSYGGPCSLFIEPFMRPLSPNAVAELHRRTRRRAQRSD
jgi:hypothetical protein